MTRVKICGITRWEDARRAAELGADALGFIFHAASPRYIEPARAAEIAGRLPPFISTVGVFVDAPADEIRSTIDVCRLSAVQLHGRETPDFCRGFSVRVIKAFRVRGARLPAHVADYAVDALLLDTYRAGVPGGTGETFDWEVACEAKRLGPVILAGGLRPENVAAAVKQVRPYAVDVSSGVEVAPGRKDHDRMADFVNRVRACAFPP